MSRSYQKRNITVYDVLFALVSFIVPISALSMYYIQPMFENKGVLENVEIIIFSVSVGLLLFVSMAAYAFDRVKLLDIRVIKRKLASFIFYFLFFSLVTPSSYTWLQTCALYGALILLTQMVEHIFSESIEKRTTIFLFSLRQKGLSKITRWLRAVRITAEVLFYLATGMAIVIIMYILLEQLILSTEYVYQLYPYHVYTVGVLFAEQLYVYYQDRKVWYAKHVK